MPNTDDAVEDAPDAPHSLPMSWLAAFVHESCSPFSFELGTTDLDDVVAALSKKIGEEVQAVQAYTRALHASGVMPAGPPTNVHDSTKEHVEQTIHPWPHILE